MRFSVTVTIPSATVTSSSPSASSCSSSDSASCARRSSPSRAVEASGPTAFCRAALSCCTWFCASRTRGARVFFWASSASATVLSFSRKPASSAASFFSASISPTWPSALALAATGLVTSWTCAALRGSWRNIRLHHATRIAKQIRDTIDGTIDVLPRPHRLIETVSSPPKRSPLKPQQQGKPRVTVKYDCCDYKPPRPMRQRHSVDLPELVCYKSLLTGLCEP
jgi:hypothetical protein